MTAQSTTAGVAAGQSLEAFEAHLNGEFIAWRVLPTSPEKWAKGNPSPLTAGGLPVGYEVVDQYPHEEFADTFYVLAHRLAGGWVLVRHESDIATTLVKAADPSIVALCEGVASGRFGEHLIPVAEPMRTTIGAMYDQTDETEAAAYTMWMLGGPMIVSPRAAS